MCSSKSYVTSPSTQNSSICTEHFCFVSPEKSHKFTLSMGVPRHQHIHNILHVGAPQQDAQFFSSGGGHSPFLSNSPGIHSTTLSSTLPLELAIWHLDSTKFMFCPYCASFRIESTPQSSFGINSTLSPRVCLILYLHRSTSGSFFQYQRI